MLRNYLLRILNRKGEIVDVNGREGIKMNKVTFEMLNFDYGDDWSENIDENVKKMAPVFQGFEEYLKRRNLKELTVQKKVQSISFFLFNYLYIYDSVDSVLEVDEITIRTFLGNWYIRKFLNPNMTEIRVFLNAIKDFYTFLKKLDLFDDINDIKEACKDKNWYQMRLETYYNSHGAAFESWIQEYNYDFL